MKRIVLIFSAFLLMITSISAQDVSRKKNFNLNNGVAISGYDPVAYFKLYKAVKGKKEFVVNQQGVTYYFNSSENKEAFLNKPSQYEPEYGGWCAYAMGATGEKVEVDPETFKIANGKLYLFYHTWVNNTLTKWNKDESNLKAKADKNWMGIAR